MGNLEVIEAASGGPFVVLLDGRLYELPDPADMAFMDVLRCLQNQHLPAMPPMREWQRAKTFSEWAAHYDLPDFVSAQRLAYLLDRYRSAIVYDLQSFAGADIGALWRSRRWRTALDLIDHLPGHSWYSEAVSGDEEHAAMIAESLAAREAEGEQVRKGPPITSWTPEVAAITELTDAVRHLTYVTAAVQGDKTSKPPEPLPRPQTPLEAAMKRASWSARKAKHDSIVARMLPHKGRT